MIYQIFYFIFKLFSLFNLCFVFEMLLCILLTTFVYLQKNLEEFSTKTKLSAPSSRSDFRVKATYVLIGLFCLNTCLLNILYQKEYKKHIVQDVKK